MNDVPNPNPEPTNPTPMNTPEARTPTGEIIDQGNPAVSPVETKPNEPAAPAEPKPPSAGAPESYSDFSVPEGATLDKSAIERATPIFKELGLTQDQAQKLVDLYPTLTENVVKANNDAYVAMRESWVSELKADKEIGGKLDHVAAEIGKLKQQLPLAVRDAFNEAVNFTGAGDHPAVVKALYEISKLVNEGSHVAGAGPSEHGQNRNGVSKRPSLAGAMYPNLPSQ